MPGDRQSEWHVILRCLALLRRLMIGEASADELIAIIRESEDQAHRPTDEQLGDKLEKDLKRLRDALHHEIAYVRAEKLYRLVTLAHPLIDLPEDALRGLAFLQKTFSSSAILHHDEVMRLIDFILLALPKARAHEVAAARGLLEVELRSRDSKTVDVETFDKISLACSTHQEIEFLYRSPRNEDGRPRRHRVEPYRVYLESVRQHYILEAYQLEISEPYQMYPQRAGTFRLERIADVRVLPQRFVPRQLRWQGKEIVYVLSPEIARLRDVTEHIDGNIIEYLPDGSAEVRAVSYNLFQDLRTLLHYGPACQVIGGEDALRDMTALVRGMTMIYSKT